MGLIGKAARTGNFLYRQLGVFEQVNRLFDPSLSQPPVRRSTGRHLECSSEIGGGEPAFSRDISQSQLAVQIGINQHFCPVELRWRQAATT